MEVFCGDGAAAVPRGLKPVCVVYFVVVIESSTLVSACLPSWLSAFFKGELVATVPAEP